VGRIQTIGHHTAFGIVRLGLLGRQIAWMTLMTWAAIQPAYGAEAIRPTARATWTDARPTIDGELSDPAWMSATPNGAFVERRPILRATPALDTTFQVLFDAEALYVGVHCQDDQPEAVVGRTRTRDSFSIFRDDAISIKLDVKSDHRTTLGFVINPSSGRLDYRGINEGSFKKEYDMVWEGAGARTEDGWSAEFRIPFTSIGIDPMAPPTRIGLNLSRDLSRLNATYDWALMPPPYTPVSASLYGDLVGLDKLPQKLAEHGIEPSVLKSMFLVPFVLAGFQREDADDTGVLGTEPAYNAGGDMELTFQNWKTYLSVNTDFAQVDLDDQVVNLDRFSLFMPEKRDFFLSDVEFFHFGSQSDMQVLHTRTIGLVDEQTIPILAGLKFLGNPHDHVKLGMLQVTTRPQHGQPWTSHTVARGQVELGDGAYVGAIVTHRQSLEAVELNNLVAGMDGTWRSHSSPFALDTFAVLTTSSDAEEPTPDLGAMGAIKLRWRGELFRPSFEYAFALPRTGLGMGYLQRTDIQRFSAKAEWEPRPKHLGLEAMNIWTTAQMLTNADGGNFLDASMKSGVAMLWLEGFGMGFDTGFSTLQVLESFEVRSQTEIGPGRYDSATFSAWVHSPTTYSVVGSVQGWVGDYYGGKRVGATGGLTIRPNDLLRVDLTGRYDQVVFDDPSRNFDSALVNGTVTWGFTPDIGLSQYVGFNHLDDLLKLQSRFRWSYLEGSDLLLVYQLDLKLSGFEESFQSLLLKATYHWQI
jgi:hypothetical protein